MQGQPRRTAVMLLALSLCLAALTSTIQGQTAERSPQSSENVDISVMIRQEGDSFFFITENLDISFVNATSSPFNTSIPALTDHFQTLRFLDTLGTVYLRVSYDATLNATRAEAYADDVFDELRKAFNLPLAVSQKTHVVNNQTASIDVYCQISGTAWNTASFEELAKYHPADGFGQLVTRNLLTLYLQTDFIPGTDLNQRGIDLEYTLTRTDLGYVWQFYLMVSYQVAYENEGHIDVNLNDLLNRSGPITPSGQRSSQVTITFLKRQLTRKTPLLLILSSSSPPYAGMKEQKAKITDLNEETTKTDLIYNLTGPIDDVSVMFNVGTETSPSSIPLIIISAVCIALVAALVFFRIRRRRLRKTDSMENSK
jgi:hypothetical protein